MPIQISIHEFQIILVVQLAHRQIQFHPCDTVEIISIAFTALRCARFTFFPCKRVDRMRTVETHLDHLLGFCLTSARP
jgi:hypothetical protein